MSFIKSSNGPWGIIDPAGSYTPGLDFKSQTFASNSYLYQIPGIILAILVISTLFIFRKYFLKTAKTKTFRYVLGIYSLVSYVIYYVLHVVYLAVVLKEPNWTHGIYPSYVRSFAEAIPLHVCSLQQILIGILLLWPNEKFFSITAPWGMIFPIVAIITPINKYWSFDNLWYYNYFILHVLILFGYLYLYLYGFVKYDIMQLRWSYASVFALSISALIWDGLFNVGLMQMGKPGSEPWIPGGFSVGKYNTNAPFGWPFCWVPMFAFGTIFWALNHMIIAKLPQLYTYDSNTKSLVKVNWKNANTSCQFIAFKWIFCSKKIIEKDKLCIANKQQKGIKNLKFSKQYIEENQTEE